MQYLIRRATRGDIASLERLLGDYMRETYHGEWGGDARRLEEDVFDGEVAVIVAEDADRHVIGFVAWVRAYDLHWCLKGGEVVDLFVSPPHRGRGAALRLIVRMASEIQEAGGAYFKGGAVEDPAVHRLYQRVAMRVSGNDYYVSGRAFRRLAELSANSLREIVSGLPEVSWNHEP